MRIVPLLFFLLICSGTRAQLLDAIALDTVRTFRSLERALEDPMQVYKLDLSKQKLKEVPEDVRKFTNLNSLDLGHNKLKTLPDWISELHHMQEFKANNNRMVNFPEAVCTWRQLKRLDMSRNALISLPGCMGRLTQLTSLDLWSNDLATFPDDLEHMEALRYVDLRVIQFSPKEMEHIADLWPRAKIQFSAPCNCGM